MKFQSYYHLLSAVLPEIQFDKVRFRKCIFSLSAVIFICVHFLTAPFMNFYDKRKLFVEYAKQHRFDPLIAENWYKPKRKKVFLASPEVITR